MRILELVVIAEKLFPFSITESFYIVYGFPLGDCKPFNQLVRTEFGTNKPFWHGFQVNTRPSADDERNSCDSGE